MVFWSKIGIDIFSDGGQGNRVNYLELMEKIDMGDKFSWIGQEKRVGGGQALVIICSVSMEKILEGLYFQDIF